MAKRKDKKKMSPLIIGKVAKALKGSAEFRCDLNSGNKQMVNGEVLRANLENYKLNCRCIVAHPSGVVIFQAKG